MVNGAAIRTWSQSSQESMQGKLAVYRRLYGGVAAAVLAGAVAAILSNEIKLFQLKHLFLHRIFIHRPISVFWHCALS